MTIDWTGWGTCAVLALTLGTPPAAAQEAASASWPDSWAPTSELLFQRTAPPAAPQALPNAMDPQTTRVFLGSAIGGFLGGYAGLWAGVLIADPCDLCWEAYTIGVSGNLLGAAKGAQMGGASWSKALEGATLGLAAAIGVTAATVELEAPDEVQIIAFPLAQGLVTTLWALR